MTDEEKFNKVLDGNPDDHITRSVFADYLEDHDDPRAMGYRKLSELMVYPHYSADIHDPYKWFIGKRFIGIEGVCTPYAQAVLPEEWWELINFDEDQYLHYWKYFKTRRDAEEAIVSAYIELTQTSKTPTHQPLTL